MLTSRAVRRADAAVVAGLWTAPVQGWSFPYRSRPRRFLEHLRSRLESGAFRPVIDRTYPLEDIVQAYRYVESGRKVGNVVITVRTD